MDSMALTSEVAMSCPSLPPLYPSDTSSPTCLMWMHISAQAANLQVQA